MAANTTLPVIGIPCKSTYLDGIDALLSTVQMPSGIPVATVAVDGGANAALLAIEMLALADDSLAEKLDKVANISFRIKPGVDAHTHDFVKTGQIDSKFGFALETGEAYEAVKKAITYDNVCLKQLHCHKILQHL